MDKSINLQLWLPEDSDPLEVSKLSENFEALDEALGDTSGTAALVKSMKLGDITYSTRNLEAESNGALIACDQREVLVSAYPELCALPFMKDRKSLKYVLYPQQFTNITSTQVGKPQWNAKVGQRYIPTSTITDANWNQNVYFYDLVDGKQKGSISATTSSMYMDDEIIIASYGSDSYFYKFLESGSISSRRYYITNATATYIRSIVRFQDKYIITLSGGTGTQNYYYHRWVYVSSLKSATANVNANNSVYIPMTGYEVLYNNKYDIISGKPGYPFCSYVEEYNDALYALMTVRNLSNTSEWHLGLFKATDGSTWNQVALLDAEYSDTTYTEWAFHIINNKMYIVEDRHRTYTIDDVKFEGDLVVYIINLDNFTDVQKTVFNGYALTNGDVYIQDNILYANLSPNPNLKFEDRPSTASIVCTLMFNLNTQEVNRMYLPEYIAQKSTWYNSVFSQIKSTLKYPICQVTDQNVTSQAVGSVDEYDKELGIVKPNKTITHAIAGSTVKLIYTPLESVNCAYNSEYIFNSEKNDGIYVMPIEDTVRVIPYIKNAYIKALNEETEGTE